MDGLIYLPTSEQVARALLHSGSYMIKDEASLVNGTDWFTWKSGIKAPVYTNCRVTMGDPGSRAVIAQSLVSSIRNTYPQVELIVGIESAGIHWSSIVSFIMGLPHAYIRKEPKTHGVDNSLFVGSLDSVNNLNAVIVDDLVASGESLEPAINILRNEMGANVLGVQSIVNWNFTHMSDRFIRLNVIVKALASYPQILKEAERMEIICRETFDELLFFYQNPKKHVFNFDFLANRIKRTRTNE